MHVIQERLLKLIDLEDISGCSLRQIGEKINEESAQKIKHHLLQLETKSFITVDFNSKKISRLKNKSDASHLLISIPLLGSANCGLATLYADENIEGYLKVSKRLLSRQKGIFALRAQGNSLNRADINGNTLEHGDFAIIDKTDRVPKDGDYILSIIDDMANIKKFKRDKKNNRIVLISESSQSINPIFIHEHDQLHVNGKVIDVIKRYGSVK